MNYVLLMLLLSLPTGSSPITSYLPPPKVGIAKYYDQYPMERVMRNRGLSRPTGVDGLAAQTDCAAIGQIVNAQFLDPRTGSWTRRQRFFVVDCSHPRDVVRHLTNHLVIEVDAASARRNGFAREGRAKARVWR